MQEIKRESISANRRCFLTAIAALDGAQLIGRDANSAGTHEEKEDSWLSYLVTSRSIFWIARRLTEQESQRETRTRTRGEGPERARSPSVLRGESETAFAARRRFQGPLWRGRRQSGSCRTARWVAALLLLQLATLLSVCIDVLKRVVTERIAYDKLLRKLSPTIKNSATTHSDLLYVLQSCTDCNSRLTFCPRCYDKAHEFFSGYTASELAMLYGRDLPRPDAEELQTFTQDMLHRQYQATHT